ncbi:MAG: NAD(P)-dependent glycerol-3-phosphate dehydrogenase [Phycisphaeraceae bacterium]|nr:NAD(P)-dependent glycerol-3-phosphate dehydrogenase [Phycisphaerales bacterium]MCB9859762.1 NAD(P)-dependent glycerol-3-phosphate dehydrogenase [Phycisphaeraceae bacterium]
MAEINGHTFESSKPVNVAILGDGQMGLVCAVVLCASAELPDRASDAPMPGRITMWGHDTDEIGRLAQSRTSPRLPELVLPESVHVSLTDAGALADADLIVSALPVQYTRDVWNRLRRHIPSHASVVSVSKGIETSTLLRPTHIIADALKDDPDARPRPIGVLSGPTIATELARCLPATMTAASDDAAFARVIQSLFSTTFLRIYTNADVLGVELAGATKNVIAIAAGILDGLQAGYNAKSALLARGIAEISRLGSAMGASVQTFNGIAGVGDLATTCFSPEGRNRSCGEALGRGERLDEYLKRTKSVVEGVQTARAVVALAEKFRVEMPITSAVHAVLFEDLDPIRAISQLMSRELRSEGPSHAM